MRGRQERPEASGDEEQKEKNLSKGAGLEVAPPISQGSKHSGLIRLTGLDLSTKLQVLVSRMLTW